MQPLGRRQATRKQSVELRKLSVRKPEDSQRAKFSIEEFTDSPDAGISGEARVEKPADWLYTIEKSIRQDIETSTKELELIKSILEDLELKIRTDRRASPELRNQKIVIDACWEYSHSMIRIRNERLRQVHFWLGNRKMGRRVPDKVPDEWIDVDIEWRRWLSGQVASRAPRASPIEDLDDTAWRVLGPLPHIMAAYEWLGRHGASQ